MKKNSFKIKGKIVFDPVDKTNKHLRQSSWKKIAMVFFKNDDLLKYYSWFITKRYNIILNEPLRGAHISFINDRINDMDNHTSWEEIKNKYNNTSIEIEVSTDVRTDGKHWWLVITEESRSQLHNIRTELGLGRPFYGLHMSIGYAVDGRVNEEDFIEGVMKSGRMNLEQSNYIHRLIEKKIIKN